MAHPEYFFSFLNLQTSSRKLSVVVRRIFAKVVLACTNGKLVSFTKPNAPVNASIEHNILELIWFTGHAFSKRSSCFSSQHFARDAQTFRSKLLQVISQLFLYRFIHHTSSSAFQMIVLCWVADLLNFPFLLPPQSNR